MKFLWVQLKRDIEFNQIMKKYFYSHFVEIESISRSLNTLDISKKEKQHLVSLAEENVHYTVIDRVLNELSNEDKKTFLSTLQKENHEEMWEFLKGKIKDIESILKSASENVLSSLKDDIQNLKKNPSKF